MSNRQNIELTPPPLTAAEEDEAALLELSRLHQLPTDIEFPEAQSLLREMCRELVYRRRRLGKDDGHGSEA